jgi:hypothetical protein
MQTPGTNVLLVGGPGEAKTDIIGQVTRAMGYVTAAGVLCMESIYCSTRDPIDFGGVMMPDGKGGMILAPMPWINRVIDWKRGVVFFDELNSGTPAVQAAIQTGVLTHRFGDSLLPEDTVFVAAMNETEQATGGWDLSDPLANRWQWLQWSGPDDDEWAQYEMMGESVALNIPRIDRTAWEAALPLAKSRVAAYRRHRPGTLREQREAYQDRFPKAFATPRTWSQTSKLLASCYAISDDSCILPLVTGAIGQGMAVEFATWLRDADLPDPEVLLVNPSAWTPDARRMDQVYAVLYSVAAAATKTVHSQKEFETRWLAAWEVLGRARKVGGKDILAMAVRILAKKRPPSKMFNKNVSKLVSEIIELSGLAGIVGDVDPKTV